MYFIDSFAFEHSHYLLQVSAENKRCYHFLWWPDAAIPPFRVFVFSPFTLETQNREIEKARKRNREIEKSGNGEIGKSRKREIEK